MNLDQLQFAQSTVIPVIGAASDLLARLMAGTVGLAQARAELRGLVSVAATRIDAAEAVGVSRDEREAARVAALPHNTDPITKP